MQKETNWIDYSVHDEHETIFFKLDLFESCLKQLVMNPIMGNFSRANFRHLNFGGLTRFGGWRIQKTQNEHGVRVFFS